MLQSNDLNLKNYMELLRVVQHKYIPRGGVVFDYGSQGSHLYIILNGEVDVLIPKLENQSSRKFEKKLKQRKKLTRQKTIELQRMKINERIKAMYPNF